MSDIGMVIRFRCDRENNYFKSRLEVLDVLDQGRPTRARGPFLDRQDL